MRRVILLLALGVCLLVTGPARAEPDEGAKLVARELMAKGRAQRAARDFSGALESFSKAHAIMHVPTTLVEAAQARADAGLLLEALELLRELSALPQAADEPAPFVRARAQAALLGASLDQRIPSVRIDLTGSPDPQRTQLAVDGVNRADCASSCRVNPGRHVIAARTAHAMAEEQLQVAEHESPSLELVFSPLGIPGEAARVAASPAASPAHVSGSAHVPTATWVAGGVALLGLSTGAWLGLSAVSQRNQLRRDCAPDCAQAAVDSVRSRAVFANVALGVGLAASALAVTSYLMERSSQTKSAGAAKPLRLNVAATPTVTAPGGYFVLGATF